MLLPPCLRFLEGDSVDLGENRIIIQIKKNKNQIEKKKTRERKIVFLSKYCPFVVRIHIKKKNPKFHQFFSFSDSMKNKVAIEANDVIISFLFSFSFPFLFFLLFPSSPLTLTSLIVMSKNVCFFF